MKTLKLLWGILKRVPATRTQKALFTPKFLWTVAKAFFSRKPVVVTYTDDNKLSVTTVEKEMVGGSN